MKRISNIAPKAILLMLAAFILLVNEISSAEYEIAEVKREDKCLLACAQCTHDDLYNNIEEVRRIY